MSLRHMPENCLERFLRTQIQLIAIHEMNEPKIDFQFVIDHAQAAIQSAFFLMALEQGPPSIATPHEPWLRPLGSPERNGVPNLDETINRAPRTPSNVGNED